MIGNRKTGVIILAAGSSSRLGYPKQLVKFKGKPLLQHSIDVVGSLNFDTKILVLGAKAAEIEKQLDLKNFSVVYNDNWEEGMSTSIKLGFLKLLSLTKNWKIFWCCFQISRLLPKKNSGTNTNSAGYG